MEQLRTRLLRLSAGVPSRPVDVSAAEAAGREARSAVLRAREHSRQALLRSARAHDRAADAHDRAIRYRSGDSAEHATRAAGHREAAEHDRILAAADPRSGGSPTESA